MPEHLQPNRYTYTALFDAVVKGGLDKTVKGFRLVGEGSGNLVKLNLDSYIFISYSWSFRCFSGRVLRERGRERERDPFIPDVGPWPQGGGPESALWALWNQLQRSRAEADLQLMSTMLQGAAGRERRGVYGLGSSGRLCGFGFWQAPRTVVSQK